MNTSKARQAFESHMQKTGFIVGSSDPYPLGLERDYWRVWQAAWQAATEPGDDLVTVSKLPSRGLLISMAIRHDHALHIPGYYDQALFRGVVGVSHAQRMESTIAHMQQLHEEVVGEGFYRPEREAQYLSYAAPIAPSTGMVTNDFNEKE